MPRAWYTNDRVITAAKRLAMFLGVLAIYFLLIQIDPIARADAWGRHQLVRLGTSVGGAIARLVASEESLAARLTTCEEDRRLLTIDVTEGIATKREVEELRSLLVFQAEVEPNGIAARILVRSVGGATTVTIDRGTQDGVDVGMAAVIGDGIYYGMVIAADTFRST
ncbi:MAG: hypothetical protein NUV56_03530, partial [Candidatus Uhrbacteria bacterium]|nr:hypothetical protein [Candidatus Uhrbacteria bacterium]